MTLLAFLARTAFRVADYALQVVDVLSSPWDMTDHTHVRPTTPTPPAEAPRQSLAVVPGAPSRRSRKDKGSSSVVMVRSYVGKRGKVVQPYTRGKPGSVSQSNAQR